MNYRNRNEENMEHTCAPDTIESLTNLMKETSRIASDVLVLSRRINGHLFGISNPCCEKEADPECFRDEVVKTKTELLATAEELSRICEMLGV